MTELVNRLRKQAACVYLATEESVADDLSDGLKKAADEIERLRSALTKIADWEGEIHTNGWHFHNIAVVALEQN